MSENSQLNSAQGNSINTGAGFWIRALARILDTIFGLVLGISAGIFGGIILGILASSQVIDANWAQKVAGVSFLGLVGSLLGSLVYEVICEGLYGATLGKLACGLHVLSEDGKPCNVKGAMIRNLAFYIDALFFGIVAYSSMSKTPLKQRYGDKWGKTIVVKAQQVPDTSKPKGIFLRVLIMGSLVWWVLLVIPLILKVF